MRTKPIKSLPKEVFSSIDNQQQQQTTRIFKSIQSDNSNTINKENRNSHAFITSSYDTSNIKNYQPRQIYKHVEQTFTTTINHDRVLPTIQRPTMGGKTISSIQPPSTKIMSSEELKLLSRRIDPNEPLSSPHASPTKPPLPNIIKKRQRPMNIISNTPPPKIQKILNNEQQFICEPCNKKYKTRNGYQYHTERCKNLTTKAPAIINCICDNSDQSSTMIECIQCNTWLHIKCVSTSNTIDESSFCCPRCIEEDRHLLHNGKTVKLSELCQAKERGKNLLQSFIDTTLTTNEEKPIRNEFNYTSLFSDDTLTTYSPVLQSSFIDDDNNNDDDEDHIPSLLFSDDLPSSDLSLPESDWFHFANFEVDYQQEQELLL